METWMATASIKIHRNVIRRLRDLSAAEDFSITSIFNLFWQPLTIRTISETSPIVTNVITIAQFPVFASSDLACSAAKTAMQTNIPDTICIKSRNATLCPELFLWEVNAFGKIGDVKTRKSRPSQKVLVAIFMIATKDNVCTRKKCLLWKFVQ